jgi:hypothetical protein
VERLGSRTTNAPVASVHRHCCSNDAVQTDQSIDKVVANTHHMTEEASLARSCTSNRRNSCRSFGPPRVSTPRSPLLNGCKICRRYVSDVQFLEQLEKMRTYLRQYLSTTARPSNVLGLKFGGSHPRLRKCSSLTRVSSQRIGSVQYWCSLGSAGGRGGGDILINRSEYKGKVIIFGK